MQLEVLLAHLGGNERTDPHHEDTDSSVGTFLMFAVRDALEHCGLLPEVKRNPAREYALSAHKETFYTQNIGFLKAMLYPK